MRAPNRTLIAGGAALATATIVFSVTLGRALADPPFPPSEPEPPGATASVSMEAGQEAPAPRNADAPDSTPAPAATTNSEPALSPEVLGLAVSEAPFEADRRPPAARYRMPGERMRTEPEPVEMPDPPNFELLGAVSAPDGGFVVIRVDGGDPQFLGAGETLGGYTLASVEPQRAVMEGAARSLEVPLTAPSPTVDTDDDDDDRRRRFRRNRGRDDDDDDEDEVQERFQDQIQQLRDLTEQFQGGAGATGPARIELGRNGPVIYRNGFGVQP